MKSSAALSTIRQLCSLGYESHLLMPEILRAVREWVPSGNGIFLWADAAGSPVQVYLEQTGQVDVAETCAYKFCNNPLERDACGLTMAELLRSRSGAQNSADLPGFEGSAMQALIGPMSFYHTLRIAVREPGRIHGVLSIGRVEGDTPFNAKDQERLLQVAPYVAHALTREPPTLGEQQWADGGVQGLIVLDQRARIHHIDDNGRRLLYYATQPGAEERVACRGWQVRLAEPFLAPLLNLVAISQERAAPPPVLHHENVWGRFSFRAHWLDPLDTSAQSLIGLTVRHVIPLSLKVLRGTRGLPISARQRELCLLLAQGFTNAEIAERMHIRPRTVGEYIAVVFGKLQVNSRETLVEKLLRNADLSFLPARS
jgi:DNA-binding CsgD family transcriptional regulator